jgi:thioredoxin-related protein
MVRALAISALAASLSWMPLAQAALFETQTSDLAAETQSAAKSGRQLAVLFELEGCPDCLRLRRSVLSAPEVERAISCHYRTVAVSLSESGDIATPSGETVDRRAWTDRLRIHGAPALAFFDQNGKLLYRHTGPISSGAEFLLIGQYVASGEAENQPFQAYREAKTPRRKADGCRQDR